MNDTGKTRGTDRKEAWESAGHPGRSDNLPLKDNYFLRLHRPLRVGLLIAFLVPLIILSLYFHFQFNLTVTRSGKLHLANLAESQRNTVDLFLQERVINIFNLVAAGDVEPAPSRAEMESYLMRLRETSDAFVDVGFIDDHGVQTGYAGPYAYLQGKDYSKETWLKTLVDRDRDYYISDIYLGFRQLPHFTIAVKQRCDGLLYILRATLDPEKFNTFLRTLGEGKIGDSALINRDGRYQVVDPGLGELLGMSTFDPATMQGSGAYETDTGKGTELIAFASLKEVPWILVVRQPLRIAYAEMYRARWILLSSIAALALLIAGGVWLTTDRLLRKAQAVQESRKELQAQLTHAAKLASVGELAAGVAHEINNPLAIISAECGVIRDMMDPRFNGKSSPEEVVEELDYIDEAVFRARNITTKLLNFARKSEAEPVSCNIHAILDEVVGGIKEREFKLSNIELIRAFDPSLPEALVDPDSLRQVVLNLVNNAGDAIEGGGTITLSTSWEEGFIRIAVTDSGRGMTHDQMQKAFLPFYTTKEVGKGTGLGLSISYGIVKSMGGRIEVQSIPGKGSSFTILLPVEQAGVSSDG